MLNLDTGGFMSGDPTSEIVLSQPIFSRAAKPRSFKDFTDSRIDKKEIKRAVATGDVSNILLQLGLTQAEFQRAITSTNSAFPVRENLEDQAKVLIPLETPMRNRIPRTNGAGLASKWKQLVSLGGGYAGATTTTANILAAATTAVVTSVAGFAPGDTLLIDVAGAQEARVIQSINAGTQTITFTAPITNAHAFPVPVVKYGINGGFEQTGALQAFFSELGAPAEHTSVYADQNASYKLMGQIGRVSGFAAAAGANFQNQLQTEKTNGIYNTMLNEENAIINGDATSNLAPWGDGTNPLAYNGLVNLITTANGTPAEQVQVAVGPLTTTHIDSQLGRLFRKGARKQWILANEQEIRSLAHLAEGAGSIIRINQGPSGVTLGTQVAFYVHPITGESVPILPSRFLSPGTMIFGSDQLPKGDPSLDVQVLPQVQLPQLAPNANVQGYVAQEIAPTASAPQVYPFLVSVFSVLRMKSALHFAISRGLTPI